LRRHVRGPVLANLEAVVGTSSTAQVSARLEQWARGAVFVAGRAGLLACGNLELAASIVERAPLPGPSATEQIGDLIAYSLTDEYSMLRARVGVAVTTLDAAS
jgi:hypothetical protein